MAPIIAAAASLIMLLAGLAAGHAQPPANVHRIGIVSPLAGSPEPPTVRAFRQMLRELGHVEARASSSRRGTPKDSLTAFPASSRT